MKGHVLEAIIIDQDRVMENPIVITFPNTQHKFCLWYIMKKKPDRLGKYGVYKTGLNTQFMKCVYEYQNTDGFERCWNVLINMYNMQEDPWF